MQLSIMIFVSAVFVGVSLSGTYAPDTWKDFIKEAVDQVIADNDYEFVNDGFLLRFAQVKDTIKDGLISVKDKILTKDFAVKVATAFVTAPLQARMKIGNTQYTTHQQHLETSVTNHINAVLCKLGDLAEKKKLQAKIKDYQESDAGAAGNC